MKHHNYKILHFKYPKDEDKENMAILELVPSILTEENIEMKCFLANATYDSVTNIKELNEENFNDYILYQW